MKGLCSILVVAIGWHLLCWANLLDPAFFPPPLNVLKNTYALLVNESLLFHIGHSLGRLSLALLVTIPLGIGSAAVAAHLKKFDEYLNPLVAFTFPLPKVAILPLLLLLVGIGDLSKVVLISIGIFYLIYINARLGLKRLLGSQALEVIKIYKLGRKDYLIEFLLKGAQLEILTGLKLAVNYGLTLVVVGEFSTSNNGIGYYIWRSWDQFEIINVYSGVFSLSLLGFVFYYFFDKLIERSKEKFF